MCFLLTAHLLTALIYIKFLTRFTLILKIFLLFESQVNTLLSSTLIPMPPQLKLVTQLFLLSTNEKPPVQPYISQRPANEKFWAWAFLLHHTAPTSPRDPEFPT